MNDSNSTPPFYINRSAINDLALDHRIGRAELRLLLHFIANNNIFIHTIDESDEFHITNLPFLREGTGVCFLANSSREDLRQMFDYQSANTITNHLPNLVKLRYIQRYQAIGMRTLFSFMVNPKFFTLD